MADKIEIAMPDGHAAKEGELVGVHVAQQGGDVTPDFKAADASPGKAPLPPSSKDPFVEIISGRRPLPNCVYSFPDGRIIGLFLLPAGGTCWREGRRDGDNLFFFNNLPG